MDTGDATLLTFGPDAPDSPDEPDHAAPVPHDRPRPPAARKKKAEADPDLLREEIEDLQQKVYTGQATPKQKIRLGEARAELAGDG